MNDIARTANISKRTLYQQFEDKEALLVDGLAQRNNQYMSLWNELETGPYTVLDTILLFYREVMNRPKWYSQKFYEELTGSARNASLPCISPTKASTTSPQAIRSGLYCGKMWKMSR